MSFQKVYIETIGCKLNQFESQALAESFVKNDWAVAPSIEDADCVVVNTCSVTGKADSKSRMVMRRAKKLGKKVVATGCYATTDFEELHSADAADLIVKNDSKFLIPEILSQSRGLDRRLSETAGSGDEFPIVHRFERTRAYVKIQDGCDKFCSYCKIPHARGRSRSLSPAIALGFIRDLVGYGYKEIVFTGVNISDYRYNQARLYDIVRDSLDIEGDFRIRLSSLQPDEFDERLLEFTGNLKFANHFHLSLQSGSTTVLERMERNYTAGFFLELVGRIRKVSPTCGISTDIIVGFPGETDQEFRETVDLVRKAEFTRVHLFPYSPRSHTKSQRLKEVPQDLKRARIRILEETALATATDFVNRNVVGKNERVLAETPEGGKGTGYTSNYIKVYTAGEMKENMFHTVRLGSAGQEKGTVILDGSL